MSSGNFTGSGLALESVSATGLLVLRLRYTSDPLATSSAGAHDALNPTLYSLTGPGTGLITGVAAVYGDPQSFDLYLAAPLAAGTWTVTVTAVQDTSGNALGAPTSLAFPVAANSTPEAVNPGASNDDAEEVLRTFFNPALKGPAWDALLHSLGVEEQALYDLARDAHDQLYKTTAGGIYLTRLAADDGTERPFNVGMSDDTFRQYAISVVSRQLTKESILRALEIFYGSDAVRASCAATTEPYALQDGDDLQILIDERVSVSTVFSAAEFAKIGQAQAVEVAASLTRSFEHNGTLAWAVPIVDTTTGKNKVAVYSPSKGLRSAVRVTGGKAQSVLLFPDQLELASGLPIWNVSFDAITNTMRLTTTSNNVDLSDLQVGDYVNIYGSEFDSGNRGSFLVTAVSVTYPSGVLNQYFEVVNSSATAQTGLSQATASSILYFRPTRQTTYTGPNRGVIATTPGDGLDVTLPATSVAVNRTVKSAAYCQINPSLAVTSLTRKSGVVTAVVPNHGMGAGDSFFLDGSTPSLTAPTTTAGTVGTDTSYSVASVWSEVIASNGRHWAPIVTLQDGRVLVINGMNGSGTAGLTAVDLFTVSGSTAHASGTQYAFSNVSDAVTGSGYYLGSAVTLSDPNADGKVLYFGGTNGSGVYAADSTLYTPVANTTGSWGSSAVMVSALAGRAAVQLSDHTVLSIGGATAAASSAVEKYTYSTNTWAAKAAMNTARCQPTAILLDSGSVLVAGGRSGATTLDYSVLSDIGPITNTAEVYDPTGDTWTAVGSMAFARCGAGVVKLGDGRVLVMGGIGYNPSQSTTNGLLASCEIYDPTLKTWSAGPPMRTARAFFGYGVVGSKLYVAGGCSSTATEYLDLDTMRWVASPATLAAAVTKSTSTVTEGLLFLGAGPVNGTTDTGTQLLTPGEDSYAIGKLNGLHQVSNVVDTNTFTFETDEQSYVYATGGTITPFGAVASSVPGPYIFDTTGGVAIAPNMSPLLQDFTAGLRYGSIEVVDATQFPDEPGYLVVGFGYANQTAPIPYLGRLSENSLKIDYSFKWPVDVLGGPTMAVTAGGGAGSTSLTVPATTQVIPAGTALQVSGGSVAPEIVYTFSAVPVGATAIPLKTGLVNGGRTTVRVGLLSVGLLSTRGAFVPATPEQDGAFYLTDSQAGRLAAIAAVNTISGAGIPVNISTTFPGDRGLGNEGYPSYGNYKLSDVVDVFGSNSPATDEANARNA